MFLLVLWRDALLAVSRFLYRVQELCEQAEIGSDDD